MCNQIDICRSGWCRWSFCSAICGETVGFNISCKIIDSPPVSFHIPSGSWPLRLSSLAISLLPRVKALSTWRLNMTCFPIAWQDKEGALDSWEQILKIVLHCGGDNLYCKYLSSATYRQFTVFLRLISQFFILDLIITSHARYPRQVPPLQRALSRRYQIPNTQRLNPWVHSLNLTNHIHSNTVHQT